MIRYDLRCENGDEFEAWFGSIADYDKQTGAGLLECPHCGSTQIGKAPMAPAVVTGRKKEARQERAAAMALASKVRAHIRANFDHVAEKFADEARKMHAGETEERAIWGEATPEQAEQLAEEGIAAAPLPPALAPTPPKTLN